MPLVGLLPPFILPEFYYIYPTVYLGNLQNQTGYRTQREKGDTPIDPNIYIKRKRAYRRVPI